MYYIFPFFLYSLITQCSNIPSMITTFKLAYYSLIHTLSLCQYLRALNQCCISFSDFYSLCYAYLFYTYVNFHKKLELLFYTVNNSYLSHIYDPFVYLSSLAFCKSLFSVRTCFNTFTSAGLLAKKKILFFKQNPLFLLEEYFYLEKNSELVDIYIHSSNKRILLNCLASIMSVEILADKIPFNFICVPLLFSKKINHINFRVLLSVGLSLAFLLIICHIVLTISMSINSLYMLDIGLRVTEVINDVSFHYRGLPHSFVRIKNGMGLITTMHLVI